MIGDVPKGAPMRCKLGKHTGQEDGGLMVFHCPRCDQSYWQTDPKYRNAMAAVRIAEAGGRDDLAREIFEETTGRKLPPMRSLPPDPWGRS